MWLFVEPFDVWLFRDARPFAMGEHTRATGAFPPLPTMFQGAIRSAALARALRTAGLTFGHFNQCVKADPEHCLTPDLGERWGTGPTDFGRFRMRGPFVARRVGDGLELLLATPLDLLQRAGSRALVTTTPSAVDAGRRVRGGLTATAGASASGTTTVRPDAWPDPAGLATAGVDEHDLEPAPLRVLTAAYRKYLLGDEPDESLVADAARSVVPDARIGIARDPASGTALHGHLFLAQFHRPVPGVGLAAEVTFDSTPSRPPLIADAAVFAAHGVLAIGGEGRAGRYEWSANNALTRLEDVDFKHALRDRLTSARFKLVLATAGVFGEPSTEQELRPGWCPPFVDPATLVGTLHEVPVKLVGAVVPKPVPVSGWDHAAESPKALRWAVPAGSVFTFEVKDTEAFDWRGRLLDKVHGRSIAVNARGEAQWGHEIGMALTFVGAA